MTKRMYYGLYFGVASIICIGLSVLLAPTWVSKHGERIRGFISMISAALPQAESFHRTYRAPAMHFHDQLTTPFALPQETLIVQEESAPQTLSQEEACKDVMNRSKALRATGIAIGKKKMHDRDIVDRNIRKVTHLMTQCEKKIKSLADAEEAVLIPLTPREQLLDKHHKWPTKSAQERAASVRYNKNILERTHKGFQKSMQRMQNMRYEINEAYRASRRLLVNLDMCDRTMTTLQGIRDLRKLTQKEETRIHDMRAVLAYWEDWAEKSA